eukprot:TRINITY_DN1184_c0_g2_i1.p1 TRINITY_DN1184_c0_g2~~TRINITY_DN1184_c0_g2_i1.p1  ORF type:complete len:955 (+),score=128.70 TRINITY_DN1184_c0_g2_i1:862-3726(+)
MADFEREYGNCQSLIGPLLNPKYDNSVEVQEFILQFRALSAKRLEAIQKKIEEMKRKIEKALRTPSLKNTTGFLREELKKHVAQQHKKLLESAAGARYYTATTLYIERLTDRIHHSLLRDRILAMTSKVKTMVRRLQMSIDGKHIDDATHDHKTVKAALLPLIQGEIYHNVPSVLRTFLLVQDIEEQLVRLIPSAKDNLAPIPFNVRLNAMKEEVRRSKGLKAHGLAASVVTDDGKGNGSSPGVHSRRSSIPSHRSPSTDSKPGSGNPPRRRSASRNRKSIQRASSSPNQSGSRFPRIKSTGNASPVSPLAATQYNVQPMPEATPEGPSEDEKPHSKAPVQATQSSPQINRAASISGRPSSHSPSPEHRRPPPVHTPSPLQHSSTSSLPQTSSPTATSSPGERQQRQQELRAIPRPIPTFEGTNSTTNSSTNSGRQLQSTWGSTSELEVTTGSIGHQSQEAGPTLGDILDLYDKHAQQAVEKRDRDDSRHDSNSNNTNNNPGGDGGDGGENVFYLSDNDNDDDDDDDTPVLTRHDEGGQPSIAATGSSPQTPAAPVANSRTSSTPPLAPASGRDGKDIDTQDTPPDDKARRKEEKRLAKAQRKADRERRRLRRKARKEAEQYTAKGLAIPAEIQAILDQPIPQTPDPGVSSPLSVGTPQTPETPITPVTPATPVQGRATPSTAVTASPGTDDARETPAPFPKQPKSVSPQSGEMSSAHATIDVDKEEPKCEDYVPPDLGRYSNPDATLARKGQSLQGLSRETAAVEPPTPRTPQPTRGQETVGSSAAPATSPPDAHATGTYATTIGDGSTLPSGTPSVTSKPDHSGMSKAERKAAKAARKADRERRRARRKQLQQEQLQLQAQGQGDTVGKDKGTTLPAVPEQGVVTISATTSPHPEVRPLSAQLRTPLSGRPVSRQQSRALENLRVEIEVAKLIESARSQRVRTARSNAPDKG